MTGSRSNGHGFFCTLYRPMMRVVVAAFGAGILLASSSVVMSFEPRPQDKGKTASKPGPKAKPGAGGKVPTPEQIAKKAARRQERLDAAADLKGPQVPLPERPVRTVTPPTLTSAELDRLIKQFLTATAPRSSRRR